MNIKHYLKPNIIKYYFKTYVLRNVIFVYPMLFLLSIVAYIYLRFVMLTSKINYVIDADVKSLKSKTYILAFWHGRLLSAFFIRKFFYRSIVLISHNRSAYIVKLIANYFRTSVIRGSGNKDGAKSLKIVIKELKKNKTVFAIAPDGSVGPLMRCNTGIATISILSKKEILPISFSAKKVIFLKSWDKFCIPLPFNSITLHLKKPISYKTDNGNKTQEDLRLEVEESLNNLTWYLDAKYGRGKIMPKDIDKRGNLFKVKPR